MNATQNWIETKRPRNFPKRYVERGRGIPKEVKRYFFSMSLQIDEAPRRTVKTRSNKDVVERQSVTANSWTWRIEKRLKAGTRSKRKTQLWNENLNFSYNGKHLKTIQLPYIISMTELNLLKERIEKLGGKLTVISTPEEGTQVKASVELETNPNRLKSQEV